MMAQFGLCRPAARTWRLPHDPICWFGRFSRTLIDTLGLDRTSDRRYGGAAAAVPVAQ